MDEPEKASFNAVALPAGLAPVTCIGASAGGLTPLQGLLASMPEDSGMAFIIILHADPAAPTPRPDMLASHTAMAVLPAEDGSMIAPNHVYVMPPGKWIAAEPGRLRLTPAFAAGMPIDFCLHRLAASYGRWGTGIILSGRGHDGAAGLRALKTAGGLALVQDPAEALYASMPQQAISLARPDFVVPIQAMPHLLMQRAEQFTLAAARHHDTGPQGTGRAGCQGLLSLPRREHNRPSWEWHGINRWRQGGNDGPLSALGERLSSNEGFESSQALLQSLNEELATANLELQKALERERQAAAYLLTLFSSAAVATILLDTDLNIRLFNPRMQDLFALTDSDAGRALSDLLPKFADPTLAGDVNAAIAGIAGEREIQTQSGAWYARAVTPYRVPSGEIQGAVVTFTDVTRLKQTALASAAARDYAELIVNAAHVPVAVLDAELRIVSANPVFRSIFQIAFTPGGNPVLTGIKPALFAQSILLDRINEMLAKPDMREDMLELEEQEPGWRLWSVSLRRATPQPCGPALIILAMEDISSQRLILRQQMQLLIDALPVASCALDGRGRIRYVSATMPAFFGYNAAELLGETIDTLIPPESRELHRPQHEAYLENPVRRPMGAGLDIEGIAKDGRRIPLDIGLSPVDTADGRLVLVMIHDLQEVRKAAAERNRLQTALAEELDDMRELHRMATKLVENAALPAMLEELLGAIMKLQHADFGNILLYNKDSGSFTIAVQKNLPAIFLEHFAQVDAIDTSAYAQALRDGQRIIIADVETDAGFAPHRGIAAQTGFRAVQSTPIRATNGSFKGILSTLFARPHVPSERELRITDLYLRMAADLIGRAQSDATLRAARRAAEEANEMKTRFLSAAGHDLRQPLQTIDLLRAVLERQVIAPAAFTTLAKLGDAANHMQELVDSLLDAGQIEGGAVKTELESIALSPLLTRLAGEFAPAASVKGLQLRHVPASAIIRSDRRLLRRILGNLLSNAVKYTDKGKILLGCRRQADTLRLEVWDTGIGVPPESVEVIFGEFQRGSQNRTESQGLGLGLYIVRHFAAQLGYRVEVRSEPGKGSMFALVIPGSAVVAAPSRGQQASASGAATPCVLLVENNEAQRDALDALLHLEGYQTIAVGDGLAALAALPNILQEAPLVIVISHLLPGGAKGAGVVRQIRSILQRQVPALILGNREASPAEMERAGPGCQFIIKPVKPAYMLAAIENAIRPSQPHWQNETRSKQPLPVTLPVPPSPESEIAVIDDDAGICDAVRAILEPGGYKIESFPSAEAYLADPQRGRFKCLLVDIGLPGMSGMELQSMLNAKSERPQTIFLSGMTDLSLTMKALQEGAADFLRKPVQGTALLQSIANVLRAGREPLSESGQPADLTARLERLTPREREVLERIIQGELNKNIAADLGISERTTEHHRQNVMRKMEVKSLAMLVRLMSSGRDH